MATVLSNGTTVLLLGSKVNTKSLAHFLSEIVPGTRCTNQKAPSEGGRHRTGAIVKILCQVCMRCEARRSLGRNQYRARSFVRNKPKFSEFRTNSSNNRSCLVLLAHYEVMNVLCHTPRGTSTTVQCIALVSLRM